MAALARDTGCGLVVPFRFEDGSDGLKDSGGDSKGFKRFKGLEPLDGIESQVLIDPMIGFGTTREEDLELLRAMPELAKKARVLVGASRKRIVKKLTGEKVTGKNLGGNIGIAVWCAMHGASVIRVHDVRETYQAIKVVETIDGKADIEESRI